MVDKTMFWTARGDVPLPIDESGIGDGSTPGSFSGVAVGADGLSGAGVTALLASPGPIGGTAPNTGKFTTLETTGLATLDAGAKVDTGTKTASATGGAATLNKLAGVITSEALTTAAGADYTLTLTNSQIAATDQVMVSIGNGTNSAGTPLQSTVTPGAGSVVVVVHNGHAADAFNGTLKVSFVVFKN